MRWIVSNIIAKIFQLCGARIWSILLVPFLFFMPIPTLWAEVVLPANFVRITSVEEISEDDVLLIGAYTSKDGFHLMSSDEIIGSGKKTPSWLQAYPFEYQDVIVGHDMDFLWQLKLLENGSWQIYSLATEKYIQAIDDNDVPIQLAKSTKTCWSLIASDKDGFMLQNKNTPTRNAPTRYLSISTPDPVRFGNYTSSGADDTKLYFFKMAKSLANIPGTAILPDNESKITMISGNFVSAKDWFACPSADVLLSDGTIAYDEEIGIWTCHYTAEYGTRFVLENDGKYLNYSLEYSTEPKEWQISNGYLSTTEVEPRYMAFTNRFCLLHPDEPTSAVGASFLPVGKNPKIEFNSDEGIKKLSGGWSAKRLAKVEWQGVCSLDLTEATLPATPTPFLSRSKETNTVIYVKAEDSALIPDDWDFVVACSMETGVLLTTGSLKDEKPFRLLYPVEIEEKLLSYERSAYTDGCWETLFVPFDADIPENFVVEAFDGFDRRTEQLCFTEQTYIPANTPLIMRYTGPSSSEERTLFHIENRSGQLEISPMDNGIFTGVYLPKQVDEGNWGIYLLDGNNFVRAAQGSRLLPFRAYMRPESNKACLLVSHPEVAHLSGALQYPQDVSVPCYTLDGRKVSGRVTDGLFRCLPSGVYIVGGRKIVK